MLLGGGLREGQLTEIVGPSSSGKTQFCLSVASHVADKHLGDVMFLDTCNSFSSQRIESIISEIPNTLVKEFLGKFGRKEITGYSELKEENRRSSRKFCLTLWSWRLQQIKSAASLSSWMFCWTGRKLMVSAGFILKKLANEHNVSVLVTNHMVGGEGGVLKPALGESWKSIPHIRLLVSRDQGSSICNISILKHTFMASGGRAEFVIHN